MSADERFIAGEDRLAALLRALPAFAPPASLENAVMAAARAEQAARHAGAPVRATPLPPKVRAYAEQAAPPLDDDEDLAFTPPAALQGAVMAEAARLQAAQATRRDAVLEEVRRGDTAQDVLGAPVSAAAQAWLREQAMQPAAEPSASKPSADKPAGARRARRWWPALGVLAGSLGVGVLSLQIVLRQLDLRDGEITLPAKATAIAANETPKQPEAAKPAAPAPLQAVAPATPAESTGAAGQVPPPRADAREAAPPAPAPAAAPAPTPALTPAPSAAQAPAPHTPAAAQGNPSAIAESPPYRAPPNEVQARAAQVGPGAIAGQRAPAAIAAPAPNTPAAPAVPVAPIAPIAPTAPTAPIAQVAPITPVSPPAPAPAIEPPRFAMRASPSAQADAARVPAPAAQRQRPGTATMSLREEPQLAMERLLSASPGAEPAAGMQLSLRVTAAAPASPEVRAWVERLWQAVPASYRPPLPYAVQADSTLPPGTVRIERQADSLP